MNKIKSYSLSITAALVWSIGLSLSALADQCSYISKEQALKAIARLDIDQNLYFLCEPCGEKIPQLTKINHLSMEKVDYEDLWQIQVNNEGIDLAYVFVDYGVENNFVNLAAIANCPAQSVSLVLPKNEAFEPEREDEVKD
jgi:hypothetical protein